MFTHAAARRAISGASGHSQLIKGDIAKLCLKSVLMKSRLHKCEYILRAQAERLNEAGYPSLLQRRISSCGSRNVFWTTPG